MDSDNPSHDDPARPETTPWRITRRDFSRLATSTVALVVLGCTGCGRESGDQTGGAGVSGVSGVSGGGSNRARLATEPFLIGPPARFAGAGVYADFALSKGVFLYCNGDFLVALSATCTHNACAVVHDRLGGQFRCPCHSSLFTLDGLDKEGSQANRPLERCAIYRRDTGDGLQLEVDPTTRYRQERGKEWMIPRSMYPIGQSA
jgi:Rieske Fe-S protein